MAPQLNPWDNRFPWYAMDQIKFLAGHPLTRLIDSMDVHPEQASNPTTITVSKLEWELRRREDLVKLRGGEKAGPDAYAGNFSTNHLVPNPTQRRQYLKAARKFLSHPTESETQMRDWLKHLEEIEKLVPSWVCDEEVTGLMNAIHSQAARLRKDLDISRSDSRVRTFQSRLTKTEAMLRAGRIKDIALETLQELDRLKGAAIPATSGEIATDLKIRSRKVVQAVAAEKLRHWVQPESRWPDPLHLWGWLCFFTKYDSALRSTPAFQVAWACLDKVDTNSGGFDVL